MGSKSDLTACRRERAHLRQSLGVTVMTLASMIEAYDTVIGPQSPLPTVGRECVQHFFRTAIEPARVCVDRAGVIEVDWAEHMGLTAPPEPSTESPDLWPRIVATIAGAGALPAGALLIEAMMRKSEVPEWGRTSRDPLYRALSSTLDVAYAAYEGSVNAVGEGFWGAMFAQQLRLAASLCHRIILRGMPQEPEAALPDPATFKVCEDCGDPDWCQRAVECQIAVVREAEEQAFASVSAAEELADMGIVPVAPAEKGGEE